MRVIGCGYSTGPMHENDVHLVLSSDGIADYHWSKLLYYFEALVYGCDAIMGYGSCRWVKDMERSKETSYRPMASFEIFAH